MRKVTPLLLMLFAVAAWAQDTSGVDAGGSLPSELLSVTSVADLDLSSATLHQAGPSSFYLRSVGIGEEIYSLLFEIDAAGTWALSELTPEASNILPPDAILDFVTVSSVDATTIAIDGVIVAGQIYSGSLSVGSDASLSIIGDVSSGSATALNQARSAAVQKLLTTDAAEFDATVQEQQAELEAERDRYKDERDALQVERDALESERDSLTIELEALKSADLVEIGSLIPPDGSPLTSEQLESLVKERNQLAGDVVGLRMENNELYEENKTLSEQISELQTENQQLRTEVATMTTEVDRLKELVVAYQSVTAGGPPTIAGAAAVVDDATDSETTGADTAAAATPPAMDWTVPGDYITNADLEAAAATVTAAAAMVIEELESLDTRIAALEEAALSLASLEEELRQGIRSGLPSPNGSTSQPGGLLGGTDEAVVESAVAPADTEGADTEIATEQDARDSLVSAEAAAELAGIEAELADLVRRNELLRQEKETIEQLILDEILSRGFVAMMRTRLTDVVQTGFHDSVVDMGDWSINDGTAIQMDSDQYFAKLAISAPQASQPVLYSFRARSLDPEGWVGFGLHLFVTDVEKRRGYGMGKSLLVWFTRDPEVYKTNVTYLQLYRSDDDINMGRVMDSIIPEPVSEYLDIDVLYEPETEYVTIAVNGVDKIRYQTWFGITSGIEVALRSLGRAEFRDFEIRTAP